MYGNGGLKLWTKTFVNNMKTHENAVSTDRKRVSSSFVFERKILSIQRKLFNKLQLNFTSLSSMEI